MGAAAAWMLIGVAITFVWLYIGWQIMVACQRIADALEEANEAPKASASAAALPPPPLPDDPAVRAAKREQVLGGLVPPRTEA